MEYEIGDETVLFDDSTNPSLERSKHQSPPARPERQRAVLIPEEEEEDREG